MIRYLLTIFRNKVNDYVNQYEKLVLTEYKWEPDEICMTKYVMWFFMFLFGTISLIVYKGMENYKSYSDVFEFVKKYFMILSINISLYALLCICSNKIRTTIIKKINKVFAYLIYIMSSVFVLPILMINALFYMITERIRHKKPAEYDNNKLIVVDMVIDIFVQMIPILVILLITWNTGFIFGYDVYASNLDVYVILGCTVSIMETIKKENVSETAVRGRLFVMCLLLCFSSILYCIVLIYPNFNESYIYDKDRMLKISFGCSVAFAFVYAIFETWRRYMRGEEL